MSPQPATTKGYEKIPSTRDSLLADDSILSLLLRSRSCSEYSLHFLMGGLALGYYYCGRQLGLRSSLKVWSTLWVGTS